MNTWDLVKMICGAVLAVATVYALIWGLYLIAPENSMGLR